MYGLFDHNGPEITASIKTMRERFNLLDDEPGIPRYENDDYRRSDPSITGNWWYITTLWHAQYELENGNEAEALFILDWVSRHAYQTGMLGEQINPIDDEIVSLPTYVVARRIPLHDA